MKINLDQKDIVNALKQYVSSQGMPTSGKHVDVSFKAGRKGAGISCEINVSDEPIPGYSTADAKATALAVNNKVTDPSAPALQPDVTTAAVTTEAVEAAGQEAAPAPSLFGGNAATAA